MALYLISVTWAKGLFSPAPVEIREIPCKEDTSMRLYPRADSIIQAYFDQVKKSLAAGNNPGLSTYEQYTLSND